MIYTLKWDGHVQFTRNFNSDEEAAQVAIEHIKCATERPTERLREFCLYKCVPVKLSLPKEE